MPCRFASSILFGLLIFGLVAGGSGSPAAGEPAAALSDTWPSPSALASRRGEVFRFLSASPFALTDVVHARDRKPRTGSAQASAGPAPAHTALGALFLPDSAGPDAPVPAVVLLHGARGVSQAHEITYARQLSALGVAALVIDVFGSRRDLASGFTERLLNITESMALADAFAALKALGDRDDIDGDRIALVGFSYGGMTTIYAAHAQVAELYGERFGLPPERRFRAHAAFYAPCIARFEDTRATGAPLLMLWGDQDEIVDPEACAAVAGDLRQGGAKVEQIVYPGAYHQWDGNLARPWRAPRGLADCDFRVRADGRVVGRMLGTPLTLTMDTPFTRKVLLGLCSDSDGYLIGANADVREQSNRALGAFLSRAFGP